MIPRTTATNAVNQCIWLNRLARSHYDPLDAPVDDDEGGDCESVVWWVTTSKYSLLYVFCFLRIL
jgi:hypothetical protein